MTDRTTRVRLSNTFNGNINNTGYALTKFCIIRSLNLDINLPIDVWGEVISWEYEMLECEVNGTKQKPLFIQLKDEVDLEITCFAFSNLADKLNEYISSLKPTEKFSVMIKYARIYVGYEDNPINKDHGCYFTKRLNFHVLKNRRLTIPSYFVRRHRINEFKFAVIRYGLQDFEINLRNYRDSRLNRKKQGFHVVMTGDWKRIKDATKYSTTKMMTFYLLGETHLVGDNQVATNALLFYVF
ncbi:replication protein A 70 kDa DNA-binding subunit D [Tanacetum coccineum]